MVFAITKGGVKRTRACSSCAGKGVTLTTLGGAAERAVPKTSPEEVDVRRILRGLAKHLHGLARLKKAAWRPCDDAEERGAADGIETAANIVAEWATNPASRKG